MSSDYYGAQAGEIADLGEVDECERCGSPLVADDPDGYDSTFCGLCELDIEDEDEPLGEPRGVSVPGRSDTGEGSR